MTTEERTNSKAEFRPTRSLRGVLILAGWLLAAAAIAGPLSFALSQFEGLAAVLLAWAVCFAGGAGALILGGLFPRPQEAMFRVLFGMALRMGFPLAVCMVIQLIGGPLSDAGFVFYLMAFYFVTLAVELVSTVLHAPASGAGSAKVA